MEPMTMKANQTNKKNNTGNIPDINDCTLEEMKKYHQPTLFPYLKGLNGGKRQRWNNENLDKIPVWVDMLGFDRFCFEAYTTRDSLTKTLNKAERQDRKSVTKAEKAMNQAYIANRNFYQLQPQVDSLVKQLDRHIEDDKEFRKVIAESYQLLSLFTGRTAQLIGDRDYIMSNFTEDISNPDIREVDTTLENVGHKETKQIEADSTPSREADRVFISNKEPGSSQLPGPQTPRLSPRQRYHNAKARRYRRV